MNWIVTNIREEDGEEEMITNKEEVEPIKIFVNLYPTYNN